MPTEEEPEEYLETETKDLKLVADYTRMSFEEVQQYDCVTFKRLLVDAFIDSMSETEDGRKYLEGCWMLKQTKPNREELRGLNK